MAKTKDKVADTAGSMRPYVERALKDEELRENVKSAFTAARQVYDELLGDRGVTGLAARVATDQDIQDNLKTAIDELRTAAKRVQGKEAHTGRNTTLLMTGIALGILFNPVTGPATRSWIKDTVLGNTDDHNTYSANGGPDAAA